ncbi:MAG: hypothetical protein MEQ84_07985 [Mesorhizobium sp.]|nr:hypothetical protein [Mesorhizobium sp.]
MNGGPWRVMAAGLLGVVLVAAAMWLSLGEVRGQVMRCLPLGPLLEHLRDRHGEHVVFRASDAAGRTLYLTRAQGGRWTLVIEPRPGMGCIASAGETSEADRGI